MSVRTTVKSIQDIMRQDSGVDGDAQRISQLCWMFFLKIIDDQDEQFELMQDGYRSPIPKKLRWRSWAADPEGITGDELLAFVNTQLFPQLKELSTAGEQGDRRRVVRDVFEDAYNYMKSGQLMRQVVNKINEVDFNNLAERQHFGDIYEQILNDLQSAGNAGEYYTPRAVTSFMVDRIDPHPGEVLLDPACGTGGFLTSALRHMRECYVKKVKDEKTMQEALRAVEKKQLPHMLCVTNMLLHGIENPSFVHHDNTLARPYISYGASDRVDIVLTNPPFGGREEDGIESNFPKHFQTRETADLFLALIIRLLKPGGRAAVVLPDGSLFGEGVKTRLKEHLMEECNLHTIVRLPNSVFKPYASIGTNLLFFEKGEPTKEIWFYEHRVEQDSSDEPTRVLINRIQAKKVEIARDGEVSREKALPRLAKDELPFRVPTNWNWSQLAEIGILNPRNKAGDEVQSSFVPMSLISAEYGVASTHEIRPWGEIKSGYTHFAEGDVALAKITPCFENGKSTVFRGLTGGIGAGTTELHVIRPVLISADYVLIFLKSPHFIGSGIPRMTGTAGQKRVPTEYFAYSPFPLPPVAEQHRIVAKVDELMALCDELEVAKTERERRRDRLAASSLYHLNNCESDGPTFHNHANFYLNQVPRLVTRQEQVRALHQTVLNLAVRGRLVPQDAADEPASKLLERIQTEKSRRIAEGALRKEKPLSPIREDEAPFAIPTSWSWARIGTCSLLTEYGTSVKSDHIENGVPVLAMGNIQGGQVILNERKRVPSQIEDLPQLFLKRFDLLYNRTNSAELVGKTGIYMGEDDVFTFASYLIRIRFLNNLTSPVYANIAMNAPYFRPTQIVPELRQQCGQANVNGSKLRNMVIPIPPFAEQERIVAKVDELAALCDELEAQITVAQSESHRLLEAVLNEALNENLALDDRRKASSG